MGLNFPGHVTEGARPRERCRPSLRLIPSSSPQPAAPQAQASAPLTRDQLEKALSCTSGALR